jgi:hypothetical protein
MTRSPVQLRLRALILLPFLPSFVKTRGRLDSCSTLIFTAWIRYVTGRLSCADSSLFGFGLISRTFVTSIVGYHELDIAVIMLGYTERPQWYTEGHVDQSLMMSLIVKILLFPFDVCAKIVGIIVKFVNASCSLVDRNAAGETPRIMVISLR